MQSYCWNLHSLIFDLCRFFSQRADSSGLTCVVVVQSLDDLRVSPVSAPTIYFGVLYHTH